MSCFRGMFAPQRTRDSVLGHPNPALVQPHPGAPLSVPHAMSVPYRHSNSYTHPRMVTRLPHLLPHTAAKSPPYRQYQQHPTPGFSLTSTASDTFTLMQPPQQSMQGQYVTITPGLPNRAPPTYSRESTQQPPARKGKTVNRMLHNISS